MSHYNCEQSGCTQAGVDSIFEVSGNRLANRMVLCHDHYDAYANTRCNPIQEPADAGGIARYSLKYIVFNYVQQVNYVIVVSENGSRVAVPIGYVEASVLTHLVERPDPPPTLTLPELFTTVMGENRLRVTQLRVNLNRAYTNLGMCVVEVASPVGTKEYPIYFTDCVTLSVRTHLPLTVVASDDVPDP